MRRASSLCRLVDMTRLLCTSWQATGWWQGCRHFAGAPHPPLPSPSAPPSPLQRRPATVAAAGKQQPSSPEPHQRQQHKAHKQSGPSSSPRTPKQQHQPHPPPQPQQQKQQQRQQQHEEYHTVSSSWHVPRTSLEHYPAQHQQRMRRNWDSKRSAAAAASSSSSSSSGGSGSGKAASAAAPSGAVAAAEQLLAVLKWEASSGYPNSIGRSGDRFSAWAAGRLTQLAAQLQPQPPAGVASSAGGSTADLARRCASLAAELASYDGMNAVRRATLTQEARLAAEELHQLALVQQKQQQLAPHSGQHGGAGSGSGSRAAAAPAAQQQQQQQEQAQWQQQQAQRQQQQAQRRQQQEARAVQQPPAAVPAAVAQPLMPPQAVDPDVVAALAHEEETANGSEPGRPLGAEGKSLGSTTSESEGEAGTAGGARRKREIAPATLGFRQSFAEAAAAFSAASGQPAVASLAGGEQRTAEWLQLRERRLTASAFSKALGFFKGDREGLWEEKVGLRAPFAGNDATAWGTRSEPLALEDYQYNTGQDIDGCMFQVKHDDMAHGWLGASPDGLIQGLQVAPGGTQGLNLPLGWYGAGQLAGPGPGILEVKCPYNKGRPELATPPPSAIWYYMPQVQGLMDIFDREWCNLYIWTPGGGSGLYHIPRDRRYWADCFVVLADFWWSHVVPARQARERHGRHASHILEQYRPPELIQATEQLKQRSKVIAAAAPATFFPARPREEA